ncbi:hypothetical protein Tco_0759180 [Tanacetum coccineum]
MIEEDNLKHKRKSRPMSNEIVIEDNDNPSLMDESKSDTKSDFGTDKPNHIDTGMDYNMFLIVKTIILIGLLITLVTGKKMLYNLENENQKLKHFPKTPRGDGCETTDSFQLVETKVEKYLMHDEDTHWQMKKAKIGESSGGRKEKGDSPLLGRLRQEEKKEKRAACFRFDHGAKTPSSSY